MGATSRDGEVAIGGLRGNFGRKMTDHIVIREQA